MPNPEDGTTSVFRHCGEPVDDLWKLGSDYATGTRTLHGAAVLKAADVRNNNLTVEPDEPPVKHAILAGWPILQSDPELEKARRKEIALVLASSAIMIRR
jgi:hypothetical protein